MHLLEDHENLHTILFDALMEIGTVAIDNIFSKVNIHLYSSPWIVSRGLIVDLNLYQP